MDDKDLRVTLCRRAVAAIYTKPAVTFPHPRRDLMFDFAAQTLGDQPITYLEFGVAKGASIRAVAERFRHPDARFFGFDTFEGLPEAWGVMKPGAFGQRGKRPENSDPRVNFVTGLFQDTLPGFLRDTELSDPILIHFDADLYSSTLFLLATLWHHVPAYWFLFDEFIPDEVTALYDFTRGFPSTIEWLGAVVDEHDRPRRAFGRMGRPINCGTPSESSAAASASRRRPLSR